MITFDVDAAQQLGQARAFVLDLRRIAFLPVDDVWLRQWVSLSDLE